MATMKKSTPKASTKYSPSLMGVYEQYDMARNAKKKMDDKASAKRLQSTKYAPAPMTAKQKETIRRAAEKKQALKNLKKDPIVKGAKAVLSTGANPVGIAAKVAGKVAGVYATGAKQIAKTVKDKVSPPKRAVGKGGKALTPAQKARLKNMTSGRLDK